MNAINELLYAIQMANQMPSTQPQSTQHADGAEKDNVGFRDLLSKKSADAKTTEQAPVQQMTEDAQTEVPDEVAELLASMMLNPQRPVEQLPAELVTDEAVMPVDLSVDAAQMTETATATATTEVPEVLPEGTLPAADAGQQPTMPEATQQPVVQTTAQTAAQAPMQQTAETAQPETVVTAQQQTAAPVQTETAAEPKAQPQDVQTAPQNAVTTPQTEQRQEGEPQQSFQQQTGEAKQDEWQVIDVRYGQQTGETSLFHDLHATPVKVGDGEVIDTQMGNTELQLAEKIDQTLKDGEQRITIRLAPDNLGAVTVQLTQNADGTLQVLMTAETAKAATLLGENAAALSEALRGNTQAPVFVEVQQQNDAHQQQQQDAADEHPHRQNQQQNNQQNQTDGQDFMQQLRLGLVTLDGQAV